MPRPEKVLERYYPQLREWAAILTRGDRTQSEDIVHDLYLYVALTKPDFSRVENLDNYLYQSLRHMYLSALTRTSREAMQSVAVADFDSVQVALWVKPNHDMLQQQNELRSICSYAVWRKPQVRGASYFVLRFFHGYRIQEIAEIACVPIAAIQPRLSEVRTEVRAYLAGPHTMQPAFRTAPPEPVQCWSPVSSQRLVQELRASILNSKTGPCLSEKELQAHYRSLTPKPVSTSRLSHIASCEECLARIDGIFRRPTLKDREPLDGMDGMAGRRGSEKTSSGSASEHRALLRMAQRHRDDVYDHRPQTLSIAVDGRIVALHEVQAQRNMLAARVALADKPGFVEVFSEQGLRIAMLSLNEQPPHGPHQQIHRTSLSNDRWIDLALTIDGQGLNAEVVYFDPALPAVTATLFEAEEQAVPILVEDQPATQEGVHEDQAFGSHPIRPGRGGSKSKSGPRLVWLWSRLNEIPSAMNPLLASALILGLASILCFFAWMRRAPSVTASALLHNAERWDAASQPGESRVIYQKVRIQTPRRAIERAIYRDSAGRRRPKRQPLSPEDGQIRDRLALAGVNWDQPLSATSYEEWRAREQGSRDVVVRADRGLLTLTTTAPSDPQIRQETFTVRESDFHPVGRTVELRDAGTIEIAELNYDVLPWSAVNDSLFEPEAALSGARAPIHPSLSIHVPAPLTDAQLDMAELSARLVLNRLDADNGERIEVVRTESGVQVKGIVETDERKQELETQLHLVPHVIPAIFSYRDMDNRRGAASEINSIQSSSFVPQPTPLEQYLATRGWSRDNIGEISHQIFDSSATIDRESQTITDLLQRFSSKSGLSRAADDSLEQLISEHKSRLLDALSAEEHSIAAVGLTASPEARPPASLKTLEVLAADARANVSLTKELISTDGSQPRSVEAIVPELAGSVAQLRTDLLNLQPALQPLQDSSPSSPAPNKKN
ncbi:RNA polymerase sigma factor [Paracidobacterium acidisoli]|uniref:RNA polymerase sigma factor n=1 Tax=Paracidobacterium acidisoli TaxID=2303751 RepID=UPI0011C1525D|nr:RNA polymerase sigma factor [Paracidobacterium acidisoli]MBT9331582.1 RNA polymerase sigma factor [Paracidobacterium acidisoli]